MTTDQSSTDKLRKEIIADALREAEEIVLRAKKDAENLLANASIEARKLKQEKVEQARSEAARQSELILATVPVETGRMRAARFETLLESVREEASRRLLARQGFEYRETLIVLASHAIHRMEGNKFVVKLSDASETIDIEGLDDEISRRVGRPLSITILYDRSIGGGGVVVEDSDGHQVWDNGLLKRLQRLWPQMRQLIAMQALFIPKAGSGGESQ